MTAAVLKHQPELFRNLLATQPAPERSSLAATTISVVFHASLIAVAVWASAQIRHAIAAAPPDPVVTFLPVAPPASAPTSRSAAAVPKSAATPSRVSLPTAPVLPIPSPVTPEIPAGGTQTEFAEPRTPVNGSSGVASSVTATESDGAPGIGQFTPISVMPTMLNAAQVRRALERSYPAFLRDAGIGGKTILWIYIDETGKVVRAEVKEGSGQAALDDAALSIAPLMRFSPAKNRENAVKVVVAVPVAFITR